MSKRLTDKQKKKIIADYVQCGNYSEVGRKWGITGTYVKKLVVSDPDSSDKLNQKKEENTLDVLAYLDSQSDSIKRFGDYIYERLDPKTNKDELKETSIRELVTSYGIMIDKMLKGREVANKKMGDNRDVEDLSPLVELLRKK